MKLLDDVGIRARSIQKDIRFSRHLPGECYGSEVVFALEKEKLFKKEWIIVAREEQIAKPGDYTTLRVVNEPILLTRDKGGKVNAFYNVCRHRGVEVAFKSGNKRNFSCPYHGWVYNLEGALLDAPMMEAAADFDKSQTNLQRVACDTWGGFIFINLDPEAPPMREKLGAYLDKMAFLKMEDCETADVWDFIGPCNWKLIIENVMDAYHVALLHATTLGKVWDNDSLKIDMMDDGVSYIEFANPTLTPDGKSRFGNLPWLPELGEMFANSLSLPPNTMMFGRCDSMYIFHAMPLSAGTVHMQVKLLLPKQHASLPDYAERVAPYAGFMRAILEEDKEMLVSMQANVSSEHFVPGQMAPLEEGIRHFLHSYVDRMFGPAPAAA